MISTIAFDTEMEQVCLPGDTSGIVLSYATAPMAAVLPAYIPPSEEELHSSFELAISGRLPDVQNRLDRLASTPHPAIVTDPETGPLALSPASIGSLSSHSSIMSTWQRMIAWFALALILLLSGFDLMGILVLHMH